MRSEDEIRRTLSHLSETLSEARDRGDNEYIALIAPLIDALHWVLGEYSVFESLSEDLDEVDSHSAKIRLFKRAAS